MSKPEAPKKRGVPWAPVAGGLTAVVGGVAIYNSSEALKKAAGELGDVRAAASSGEGWRQIAGQGQLPKTYNEIGHATTELYTSIVAVLVVLAVIAVLYFATKNKGPAAPAPKKDRKPKKRVTRTTEHF